MTRNNNGTIWRVRRIAAASAVAVAALIATSCGREADRPAVNFARTPSEAPYRTATALTVPRQPEQRAPLEALAVPIEPARVHPIAPEARAAAAPPPPAALDELSAEPAVQLASKAPLELSIEPAIPVPSAQPVQLAMPKAAEALPGVVDHTEAVALAILVDTAPVDPSAPEIPAEEVAVAKPVIEQAALLSAPSDANSEAAFAMVGPAPAAPTRSAAYIPQISDTVRAAYIAQVAASGPAPLMAVRSGGALLGDVQFQVADGTVSVNIGQVLDLFEGRIDSARFAQLRGSQAAGEFVSLDRLRGAGIPIEYNAAYDELTLG